MPHVSVTTVETADELEARANELEAQAHDLRARACRMRVRPTNTEWLALEVAAAEIGVRPRVIRDAARRGELELGSAGRRPVVTRAELARWVASRSSKNVPE